MDTKEQSVSYLTFKLDEEEFAVHVSMVLNILELTKITKVPKTPEYILGVINLRGIVLPVIDARIKLGMEQTQTTENTCIIVMDLDLEGEIVHTGILVDQVVAVRQIEDAEIKPAPGIGEIYNSDFIKGLASYEDNFIMILDMQRVFSTGQIVDLKSVSRPSQTDIKVKKNDLVVPQ